MEHQQDGTRQRGKAQSSSKQVLFQRSTHEHAAVGGSSGDVTFALAARLADLIAIGKSANSADGTGRP